ncbi:hypothetical protein AV530_018562 [Patagioenas fasciata monilis]|uniref:Uncharacterized protein n=1 Tax=Patagioenas fasciata monilis TaxID=372326 RepID=A0A1V4JST5_PATFA|nr:hypothetical protein AV530_018562 [Patagioenas fasciata monilis]
MSDELPQGTRAEGDGEKRWKWRCTVKLGAGGGPVLFGSVSSAGYRNKIRQEGKQENHLMQLRLNNKQRGQLGDLTNNQKVTAPE